MFPELGVMMRNSKTIVSLARVIYVIYARETPIRPTGFWTSQPIGGVELVWGLMSTFGAKVNNFSNKIFKITNCITKPYLSYISLRCLAKIQVTGTCINN